jgi:hypothetical protein
MGTPEGHQKSIFNTSKVKKNKDIYGIYPTKFGSSTQKKKIIRTPNLPIRTKIFQKRKRSMRTPDRIWRLDLKS